MTTVRVLVLPDEPKEASTLGAGGFRVRTRFWPWSMSGGVRRARHLYVDILNLAMPAESCLRDGADHYNDSWERADINRDGMVNLADFQILATNHILIENHLNTDQAIPSINGKAAANMAPAGRNIVSDR